MKSAAFWRVSAILGAVAIVLVGVLAFWVYQHSDLQRHREVQHQTLEHKIAKLVFARFESSDIIVRSGTGQSISIQRELRWTGDKPEYEEVWSDDVLTISHHCGDSSDYVCSIRYTVTVPADAHLELDAETSSGDLLVSGMDGPLRLSTVSGDLSIRDAGSSTVEAQAVSGDLTATFDKAPQSFSAETVSGDLTVEVPRGSGPFNTEAETVSGDRTVTVDSAGSATARLTARTVSGDLVVRYS